MDSIGGSVDVLLVEAYADLREVLVEVLAANGYTVRAYASASDALAEGPFPHVRVVLVGVNGYQREQDDDLAQLQRGWRGPQVPFIALASGDGSVRLPEVAQVLHKPVGEDVLCRVVGGCSHALQAAV